MTPGLVFIIIIIYFSVLILISVIPSKGADTTTFFTANRQSPWYLVAFGMIGSSLSGVNFYFSPWQCRQIGRTRPALSYFKNHWLRPPAISGSLHPAAEEKSNIIILK